MAIFRIILIVLAIGFAAMIAWAISTGDFAAEGNWLVSNPWGIISLTDLYIGFVLSAVVIAAYEKPLHAALWIAPIPVLGNVWTLIWFAYRLPGLWARLKHR
ncbi:MAG: hypothetical protein WA921_01610 [Ahrensia sp.]